MRQSWENAKLNDCLKLNLKELEDTSRRSGEVQGIPTGYGELDKLLLGMQPGQLIILAARPAMGKTALALNVAVNSVAQSGLPVAIFSLEMLANELSMRLLSSRAKVDSKRIRTKDFMDQDLRSIGRAVQELSTFPIFINDSGDSTILDIQSQCRKIKSESGLGTVVIDYLQLMSSHNKSLPREQQISEMSRGLKTTAKELQCPVIALSQLNRGVEARPNKRPNTADLRESGAIEQDADIVMFVYRDEYYNEDTKEPGIAELIVGKNRAGETGTPRSLGLVPTRPSRISQVVQSSKMIDQIQTVINLGNGKLRKYSEPTFASLYKLRTKIDLISGKEEIFDGQQLLNQWDDQELQDSKKVFHLFYELGYLIEGIESKTYHKHNPILAIEIHYSKSEDLKTPEKFSPTRLYEYYRELYGVYRLF